MLIILKAMINFKKIKEYPIKKCKGFGYTFGAVFLAITFYFFFKFESFKLFLSISLCFFLLTFFFPACFKLPAFLWEKFGLLLGRFFSPIILALVYVVTILPVNLVLRIFSIDLLSKKINKKTNSYWVKKLDDKVNFRNQF